MEFERNDEQVAFRDAARQFAANEFAPHAAEWDESAEFPRAAIAKAGQLGFRGLYTPVEAGGPGLSRHPHAPDPGRRQRDHARHRRAPAAARGSHRNSLTTGNTT